MNKKTGNIPTKILGLEFSKSAFAQHLDSLVLHRFLGIPIFLGLIYLVFTITIQGGGKIQSLLSEFLQSLLIEKVAILLHAFQAPDWVIVLLSSGLGQGIHTTLCFIPVIASMFFCLSFLEATGYMARAAIVMDKIMNKVGLSGKSFMPMILGFGCNVPAILSTRSLKDPKERILTVLMTPFMSCGARLAVYALFVAAFFPENGANIIFALYMVGIGMALLTAWILGRVFSKQDTRTQKVIPQAISKLKAMPKSIHCESSCEPTCEPHLNPTSHTTPYRWPNFQKLAMNTFLRVNSFIFNAGKIILPLCMLIGFLGALKTDGQESYMTRFGRHITPIFAPMGIKKDNWQATVGLLSGLAAKEVMVGTLSALYVDSNPKMSLATAIVPGTDVHDIDYIDSQRDEGDYNIAPTHTESKEVLFLEGTMTKNKPGSLAESFGSAEAAFAYLLFVLLYFPCVSVLATISRELNFSWAIFSSIWTTGLAYAVAVLFYQTATFNLHPGSSMALIGSVLICLGLGVAFMKKWAIRVIKRQNKHIVPTRIIILES